MHIKKTGNIVNENNVSFYTKKTYWEWKYENMSGGTQKKIGLAVFKNQG